MTSIMRRHCPTRGCCTTEKNYCIYMQVKQMQNADVSIQVFFCSVADDCVPLMSDATSLGKWFHLSETT
jgi:hypothetical protein